MQPALRAGVCLAIAALILATPERARADGLQWLVPDRVPGGAFEAGLVQIDGAGRVTPAAGAEVSVSGGKAEASTAGGPVRVLRIVPAAATVKLEATLGGIRATASVEVGPPPLRIAVSATPDAPIKGETSRVELQIAVTGADGRPAEAARPVLRANVGALGAIEPAGVGLWRAAYSLPEERHPEVAIVVAFLPWPHPDSTEGAFGSAIIPLASAVSLPGRTEPNAQIAVEIAGRTFGPVRSDGKGNFELPVVVPPGHRFGTTIATDRAGNKRRKPLDLRLPPTDQLACVGNPATLPADGRAEVRILCVATDPFGKPVEAAKLRGTSRLGVLRGPGSRGGGAWEWEYTAPDQLAEACAPLLFEFPAGGPGSRESLCPRLTPLVASSAEVKLEPSPVFMRSKGSVLVRARDALGRPAKVEPALKVARGTLGAFEGTDALKAAYTPPEQLGDWRDALSGVLFPERGGEVASFRTALAGGRLTVQALDLAGRPVPGAPLMLGAKTQQTDRAGLAHFELPAQTGAVESHAVAAASGLRAAVFVLRGSTGPQLWPARPLREPIAVQQPLPLAPPAPVDVRVELSAERLRYLVRTPSGEALRDRDVAFEVVRGDGARVETGAPKEESDGSITVPLRGPTGGTLIAKVTDVTTGVSASRRLVLP